MKRVRTVSRPPFTFVLLLLTLLSCNRKGPEPLLEPLSADTIDGTLLWRRISVETDYHDYGQWPAHSGMLPGQSPHGVWHEVFANRRLFDGLPAADSIAPDGSIIVKANFDADRNLRNLTVMAKTDGYNPENGDWFWAMYDPDGTVRVEGSPGGCISCHEGMRSNDFVIINPLDRAP